MHAAIGSFLGCTLLLGTTLSMKWISMLDSINLVDVLGETGDYYISPFLVGKTNQNSYFCNG